MLPKLLFHEYVAPPLAVKEILVCVHVNTVVPLLFVIVDIGNELSFVNIIFSESVHPFAAVAVTVYVPAVVAVILDVVSPLDQIYVIPPVAVNEILVVPHVSIVDEGGFIPAIGGVIFCVIV